MVFIFDYMKKVNKNPLKHIFIAQDVTAILEYSDTYGATKKLRKQDKFVITEFATCFKQVTNFIHSLPCVGVMTSVRGSSPPRR